MLPELQSRKCRNNRGICDPPPLHAKNTRSQHVVRERIKTAICEQLMQTTYAVDVSQNHVNFQSSQEEKCIRMIRLHEERGTADTN